MPAEGRLEDPVAAALDRLVRLQVVAPVVRKHHLLVLRRLLHRRQQAARSPQASPKILTNPNEAASRASPLAEPAPLP